MSRVIIRFLVVGTVSTGIHFFLLYLFYRTLDFGIVSSTSIGFSFSLIASYLGNYYFTFQSSASHDKAVPKFLIITVAGYSWNVFIMYGLVDLLDINYIVAFLVMSFVVASNNFFLSRIWAFKQDYKGK